ncbi:aminodeoxychorismate lyase [Sulfuritortus calidifontis]|nr:aminodeoxychorismate lyase [Sulfuritortus calidifontis]
MSGTGLILIDGEARETLAVLDRGLMYGDGVFRTLRLEAGQAVWWHEHLTKLAHDCARLGLACPAPELWAADLQRLSAQRPDGVLKLVVTRGIGSRGYQPPQPARPTRIALLAPLPEWPASLWQEGVAVRVCDLRLGRQPRLAGVKHLNRLENVLARAEWDDPDIREGLLLAEDGRVISGVSSNVFIWHKGELLTPRLHDCGVAGVARNRVLRAAAARGMTVRERDLTLDELLAAEAVWLTNSLIRVWRVARLGERIWPQTGMDSVMREFVDG